MGIALEDVALLNIQQNERAEWLEKMSFRIDQALNGIAGKNQRDIIMNHYLEDEDICDYMVYNEMGMSER
ncbi:Phage transcriptional regulator, ArpU [Bacillus thuringiensis serovar monterrey BGSC 4AJ1]|nr:Phage transcriptional regulator, ArpU [Bacillus thuringiensis serovar monterrey BGSC 4AJ1]